MKKNDTSAVFWQKVSIAAVGVRMEDIYDVAFDTPCPMGPWVKQLWLIQL